MRLVSSDGDELALSIVGYQFPDAEDPRKRFSWNMIEGHVVLGDERWGFRWALSCDEPPLLAGWFRAVATWVEAGTGEGCPKALTFTEPNLSFEVLESRDADVTIGVGLDVEFRSPSNSGAGAGNPTLVGSGHPP